MCFPHYAFGQTLVDFALRLTQLLLPIPAARYSSRKPANSKWHCQLYVAQTVYDVCWSVVTCACCMCIWAHVVHIVHPLLCATDRRRSRNMAHVWRHTHNAMPSPSRLSCVCYGRTKGAVSSSSSSFWSFFIGHFITLSRRPRSVRVPPCWSCVDALMTND